MLQRNKSGQMPDPARLSLKDKSVFLDFDGTLVDIAPAPDAILVPGELRGRLAALQQATDGAVAIVSGREVADIETWLPDFTGPVAGGHGSHLRTADGSMECVDIDTSRLGAIQNAIAGFADASPGLIAEMKTAGCVLHYRQNPDLGRDAGNFVADLIASYPEFAAEQAKMAIEIKATGVSKANAVETLMAAPPFAGRTPLFAGDDVSDEAAFEWVNERGGISIRIGDGPSAAQWRISSVAGFASWIDSGLGAFSLQQPDQQKSKQQGKDSP